MSDAKTLEERIALWKNKGPTDKLSEEVGHEAAFRIHYGQNPAEFLDDLIADRQRLIAKLKVAEEALSKYGDVNNAKRSCPNLDELSPLTVYKPNPL